MLILKLLLNLRILNFHLKIREISFWINVIVARKRAYILFIANLNILLEIMKLMLIKIRFRKKRKFEKK